MFTNKRLEAWLEFGVRMAADIVMVNVAWAAALFTRFIIEIVLEGGGSARSVLLEYVDEYAATFWFLTIISLAVFYISGFYTRGRYYQGRYKALVVAQAVSLSYLLFGFIAFLSRIAGSLPRSVLFMGWLLTCALLICSRFWSMLWPRLTTNNEEAGSPIQGEKTRSRRVLVIGGAGYIGSALLPKLLEAGYRVRLFDLFLFGREPVAKVLGHPKLEIVQADFRHIDQIVHAMKEVDDVIHLGAIVGDPACSLDQDLTLEVNLIATRMIGEVAKGSGIRRFCFASTCSVYGANDDLLDERSELNPISLYARSKLASERVLMQMTDHSFCPVILRFGTVYGLSGRTRFDLVVNLLTAKAVVDGKITVFGGAQWRPFLHVDDAALALLKAVAAPMDLVHNQIFNVGADQENYRLEDAARAIQALVPKAEIVDMGPDMDFRNYRVDFSKIARLLAFAPRWRLEDGVKQVIAALESGEVRDYRHPMHSNVKFLSEEYNSRLIRRENGWASQMINEAVRAPSATTVGAAT